jgi:hypothetical protein
MATPNAVTRYVITHLNKDGMRTLSTAMQGRHTHATEADAVVAMLQLEQANSAKQLASVYGAQALGTFQVRPCPCWPVHFDPQTCWFD